MVRLYCAKCQKICDISTNLDFLHRFKNRQAYPAVLCDEI